ncbi:hypothetical protein ASG12_07555 [Williamsia sp. Leaf354]|nr:hypothetical protein ASG12_07555 [Williamsia sp. Leaf354]
MFVESPDRIAVGDHAVNESQRNPAAFIPSPKRLIGPPTISVNGFSVPTWLPVSAVFSSVISRASSAHAGELPAHLVLTHPEAWSGPQIRVLVDAAVSAGMPAGSVSTVSEPRAAVAHYARSARLPAGARVAVFDFGGGTLDVAVLQKQSDSSFTVLAARGENSLGGKNFDALIRRWVDEQLSARNPELGQFLRRDAPVGVRVQLDDSIRRAKELLSETPSAAISVSGGGFQETLQLTRDEFEELITPPLTVARQLTQATLSDAGISGPDDLAALYLTGGTSRIPLVHAELAGLGPVATLDDPKTVVAQGALATWLAANPQPVVDRAPSMPDLSGGREAATSPISGGDPATPVGWGRADSVPPAARRSGSRRTPLLIAGAVAAAVVVAVAAVVVLTTRQESTPSSASAGPSSSAAPVTLSYNQEQVFAALPASLRGDLQNCAQDSFSNGTFNAYAVKCVVRVDSSLLQGIADTSTDITVSAYVDQRGSQRNLATYKANATGATYVPGSENTSGALVQQYKGDAGPNWFVSYANSATFLSLDAGRFASQDNAEKFLQRLGLLP